MPLMPFHLPKLGVHSLLSLLPLAAGACCVALAFDRRRTVPAKRHDAPPEPSPLDMESQSTDGNGSLVPVNGQTHVVPWRFGLNLETGFVLTGLGMIGWSLGGGRAKALAQRPSSGRKPGDGEDRRIRRPDGTEIHAEFYGPPDGNPILFIHGLGSDCDEWFEIRQRLIASGHRLIDWDLAGLGESTPPADGDWSMERAAGDLNAVIAEAGDRPVVLLGHSLGGMILLTFCRLFPETLKYRVAGIVLAHTTYTNPMKTNSWPAGLCMALQGMIVEPSCYLTIGLSQLLWPLSVLDYLSGEAHNSLAHNLFTGGESKEILDFLASYFFWDRPGAIGRYSLAMLRYDETDTLGGITVPTLIVAGDLDDSCIPEAHEYMRDHIPGARMMTLSPAKHGGLLEHPQLFTGWLTEFTAACAASR
jgi:pimeloyl-ACP methyl ester carboxylesterase